eukprot:2329229-Rhodomonas_salina.1
MEEGFSVGPEDICAHPDPSLLARYTTCCTPQLYAALKRVLCYLISTKECGITWTSVDAEIEAGRHKKNELYCYVNTAYADDPITRKSTMGYVLMLNGGAISWRSKRQPIVALLTAEAEYVAACYAAQE